MLLMKKLSKNGSITPIFSCHVDFNGNVLAHTRTSKYKSTPATTTANLIPVYHSTRNDATCSRNITTNTPVAKFRFCLFLNPSAVFFHFSRFLPSLQKRWIRLAAAICFASTFFLVFTRGLVVLLLSSILVEGMSNYT